MAQKPPPPSPFENKGASTGQGASPPASRRAAAVGQRARRRLIFSSRRSVLQVFSRSDRALLFSVAACAVVVVVLGAAALLWTGLPTKSPLLFPVVSASFVTAIYATVYMWAGAYGDKSLLRSAGKLSIAQGCLCALGFSLSWQTLLNSNDPSKQRWVVFGWLLSTSAHAVLGLFSAVHALGASTTADTQPFTRNRRARSGSSGGSRGGSRMRDEAPILLQSEGIVVAYNRFVSALAIDTAMLLVACALGSVAWHPAGPPPHAAGPRVGLIGCYAVMLGTWAWSAAIWLAVVNEMESVVGTLFWSGFISVALFLAAQLFFVLRWSDEGAGGTLRVSPLSVAITQAALVVATLCTSVTHGDLARAYFAVSKCLGCGLKSKVNRIRTYHRVGSPWTGYGAIELQVRS